jgi:hypothetical protein
MVPKDWTLLGLAAARGQSLQPVHLQKALFLLGRELTLDQLRVDRFYQFEPYDYGPLCSAVYADADALHAWHVLHRGDAVIEAILLGDGSWTVRAGHAEPVSATLAHESVVSPYLTVLVFNLADGRRRSLLVLPDNVRTGNFPAAARAAAVPPGRAGLESAMIGDSVAVLINFQNNRGVAHAVRQRCPNGQTRLDVANRNAPGTCRLLFPDGPG